MPQHTRQHLDGARAQDAGAPEGATRHLISVRDLSDDELRALVARGAEFAAGAREETLAGAIVGIYFRRTSTRTRTAFTSGALRLGARTVTFGPGDLQLNTGETSEDTGRVLAGMLDLLVARTSDATEEMRTWAAAGPMSVVNAMSAEEHPTQALTDLTTLHRHFGQVDGLRVLYVGEGNNSAAALALALSRFPGTTLDLRTPTGYGLPADVAATAVAQADTHGATVRERHDMADLPEGVHAIYTTRWQTTGTTKPTADWREVFAPFQVTRELWRSSPDAVFLHDLPAHRGEEVTAEVLDGPASIAFTQATHKLHSAMAVLEWCRAGAR
ncbi:ornithine carbamoyltransferase [Streptomyces spectabilis]|uniref:Ornithine carbamoyltransferase n=1 Tax=Streptomyces spectabilis TaxID=68270 RepID=A0A5P2X259_STRST|nr:ornithine carbamoyltransferase [Streptomyces spectabilis]MBB5101784.1 ornithine carbamoyltransferase [Streptomyces spectabilis]MCI3900963.1 ornithine carbamoyltransferase [Streptomyces spectabilis]QEV58468.1 ornithine carbamoyltransferase [Streptomyces spectabilis]GGV56441.1 ornithine carbamoyltransferase [Streptomyces spectabilis]